MLGEATKTNTMRTTVEQQYQQPSSTNSPLEVIHVKYENSVQSQRLPPVLVSLYRFFLPKSSALGRTASTAFVRTGKEVLVLFSVQSGRGDVAERIQQPPFSRLLPCIVSTFFNEDVVDIKS